MEISNFLLRIFRDKTCISCMHCLSPSPHRPPPFLTHTIPTSKTGRKTDNFELFKTIIVFLLVNVLTFLSSEQVSGERKDGCRIVSVIHPSFCFVSLFVCVMWSHALFCYYLTNMPGEPLLFSGLSS